MPRAVRNECAPTERLVEQLSATHSLEQVVLPFGTQDEIWELLEEQRRVDELLAAGLTPRHKVMLIGPPGTGKTTLAGALAIELGRPLLSIRHDSLIDSHVGESAKRLRRAGDEISATPCVALFDELDALCKSRGDEHELGELKRLVVSFLALLDSLPSSTLVVGCSNHPELLDRAVWRRFQMRLQLPSPTRRQIAGYLDRLAEEVGELPGGTDYLARQLHPINFAELRELCDGIRRKRVLWPERDLEEIVPALVEQWIGRPDSDESIYGVSEHEDEEVAA